MEITLLRVEGDMPTLEAGQVYRVLKSRNTPHGLDVLITTDPVEYWVPETDYEIVSRQDGHVRYV